MFVTTGLIIQLFRGSSKLRDELHLTSVLWGPGSRRRAGPGPGYGPLQKERTITNLKEKRFSAKKHKINCNDCLSATPFKTPGDLRNNTRTNSLKIYKGIPHTIANHPDKKIMQETTPNRNPVILQSTKSKNKLWQIQH